MLRKPISTNPDAASRSAHDFDPTARLPHLGDTTMSIKPQVLALIDLVQRGKMLEAITTYYAEDVAMQENTSAPTVGFAANYAREAAFYGSLQSASFRLVSVVVE